jgi:hypothetical protein
MTVYDIIEKESRSLPEDKAIEVLDFIEFLKTRPLPAADAQREIRRIEALKRLNALSLDFGGKPMDDRDAANARD